MKNPFKFGTIVEDNFFTDRVKELAYIKHAMNSENHLILISPRRFGKSSLVKKAVKELGRPYISINLQMVVSTENLAITLLKEVFKLHPMEKIKHLMSHFRIIPSITTNPMTDAVDISFQPMIDTTVALEDALKLLEKVSSPENQMIVVLDEFQEIENIDKGLNKKLRAIMQEQRYINYIFLGSQESMMTQIFERKKSPFYHFGTLMHLDKIPENDFLEYISTRLPADSGANVTDIAKAIVDTTLCHPYYTQQLASQVWEILSYSYIRDNVVSEAISQITTVHDLDFERLWVNFNKTDKFLMLSIAKRQPVLSQHSIPTSTLYSGIKRLMQAGYVIKTKEYEVEDPFFRNWILRHEA